MGEVKHAIINSWRVDFSPSLGFIIMHTIFLNTLLLPHHMLTKRESERDSK